LDKAVVSVIIPAFNAAEYLRRTLDSVLTQTYQKIEVIVVDDGSLDATGAIVQEFVARDPRVQLIRQSNAGVGAARNTGIRRARGKYIAPLDADDFWFPEKLEKQVARLEQCGNETGLVYCWSRLIDQDGALVNGYPHTVEGRLRQALILRNIVGNGSAPLFRAAALDKVGLYLTRAEQGGVQGCEDWDLYIRISEHYGVCLVPDYLLAYRQAGSSMSVNVEKMATSFAVVMRRAQERNSDLPASIFRWSAGCFYHRLVENSYRSGDPYRSLRYLKDAVRADPALLLRTSVYKTSIQALRTVITGALGLNPGRKLLVSPLDEKEKRLNAISKKKGDRPFISNRIFDHIERRRWSAALDNGA
jgi:glycosyltransferase involved in cell wall biosynthesis